MPGVAETSVIDPACSQSSNPAGADLSEQRYGVGNAVRVSSAGKSPQSALIVELDPANCSWFKVRFKDRRKKDVWVARDHLALLIPNGSSSLDNTGKKHASHNPPATASNGPSVPSVGSSTLLSALPPSTILPSVALSGSLVRASQGGGNRENQFFSATPPVLIDAARGGEKPTPQNSTGLASVSPPLNNIPLSASVAVGTSKLARSFGIGDGVFVAGKVAARHAANIVSVDMSKTPSLFKLRFKDRRKKDVWKQTAELVPDATSAPAPSTAASYSREQVESVGEAATGIAATEEHLAGDGQGTVPVTRTEEGGVETPSDRLNCGQPGNGGSGSEDNAGGNRQHQPLGNATAQGTDGQVHYVAPPIVCAEYEGQVTTAKRQDVLAQDTHGCGTLTHPSVERRDGLDISSDGVSDDVRQHDITPPSCDSKLLEVGSCSAGDDGGNKVDDGQPSSSLASQGKNGSTSLPGETPRLSHATEEKQQRQQQQPNFTIGMPVLLSTDKGAVSLSGTVLEVDASSDPVHRFKVVFADRRRKPVWKTSKELLPSITTAKEMERSVAPVKPPVFNNNREGRADGHPNPPSIRSSVELRATTSSTISSHQKKPPQKKKGKDSSEQMTCPAPKSVAAATVAATTMDAVGGNESSTARRSVHADAGGARQAGPLPRKRAAATAAAEAISSTAGSGRRNKSKGSGGRGGDGESGAPATVGSVKSKEKSKAAFEPSVSSAARDRTPRTPALSRGKRPGTVTPGIDPEAAAVRSLKPEAALR